MNSLLIKRGQEYKQKLTELFVNICDFIFLKHELFSAIGWVGGQNLKKQQNISQYWSLIDIIVNIRYNKHIYKIFSNENR